MTRGGARKGAGRPVSVPGRKLVRYHLQKRHIEFVERCATELGIGPSEMMRQIIDEKIEASST